MYPATVITVDRGNIVALCDDGTFIKMKVDHGQKVSPGKRLQIATDKHGEFYVDTLGSVVEVPDVECFSRAEDVVKMHDLNQGFGFIKFKAGNDLHFTVYELTTDLMARNLKGFSLSYLVAKTSANKQTAVFVQNVPGQEILARG